MLKARNITKWFGTGDSKTTALQDVSFDVNYGEMLYIVGPSGSGKTTLLSIISGILRPNVGSVTINNQELWTLTDEQRTEVRLYSIGFVFQDFHLFGKLTTKENVAIPLLLQKKSWDYSIEQAVKNLTIVGLEKRADLPPYKLSIGEQQRVAIARAISTNPEILIFDEPTASLDGETGKRIISFVKENFLNDKRAVIVVTHDNRIYEYASRIIHMEDGKIIEKTGKLL